jgi:FKBP-type peptidyl-prolyl cis-trans isomerase FkpA
MLRVIVFSLLALAAIFVAARYFGPTSQQIEDSILLAELNAEEGAAYRQTLAGQPGVVTLPGGLLVEVLQHGDGDIPREDDWVQVHYRGWHIDGREFENSWRRREPATLPVEQAIAGWRQALLASPEGSRLRLVLPPELAYGRAGGGVIGPEETLIFELELLDIVIPAAAPERDASQQAVPNLR